MGRELWGGVLVPHKLANIYVAIVRSYETMKYLQHKTSNLPGGVSLQLLDKRPTAVILGTSS